MIYSVKFNGVELGELIDVLQDFTPSIGVEWSPELLGTSGTRKGSEFAYTTYKSKAIPMPFTMTDDLEEKYDKLMEILNVSKPKPLVFESVPDRVFYAIPSGDLDFSEEGPLGEGTITWIIPDGVAHATAEKSFQAEANDDGVLEVTVVNNGTEAVPVDYEITHNHENGYIGIVSEYGAIQLGKMDEVDGETYEQNEVLATFPDILSLGDDHGTNYMNPDHVMGGTLGTDQEEGNTYLVLESVGSAVAGKWNGGMRTLALPADSAGHQGAKNFYCYFRHWFESDQNGQTGVQSIVFLDEDNTVICGYKIYKIDSLGNTAYVEMLANGQTVRTEQFTSIYYDTVNPYDKERGHNCIRKEGRKLTFYWQGNYWSLNVPEVENMECRKIQISISQYGTRNLSGQYVKRNCFRALSFEKMNVEKWRDVPNRYSDGDVVTIDGATTKIYRNGMNITGDEVTGAKYFSAPPGETKIQFSFSDFSNPKPTVKAKIREAYL